MILKSRIPVIRINTTMPMWAEVIHNSNYSNQIKINNYLIKNDTTINYINNHFYFQVITINKRYTRNILLLKKFYIEIKKIIFISINDGTYKQKMILIKNIIKQIFIYIKNKIIYKKMSS